MKLRVVAPVVVVVALAVTTSISAAQGYDYITSVNLSGPASGVILGAAQQMAASASDLTKCKISYSGFDPTFIVTFRCLGRSPVQFHASEGVATRLNVVLPPAAQESTIEGSYVAVLVPAYKYWHNTPVGAQTAFRDFAVSITHPFPTASSIYWITFIPPEPLITRNILLDVLNLAVSRLMLTQRMLRH